MCASLQAKQTSKNNDMIRLVAHVTAIKQARCSLTIMRRYGLKNFRMVMSRYILSDDQRGEHICSHLPADEELVQVRKDRLTRLAKVGQGN
jgi:hypothetical protein